MCTTYDNPKYGKGRDKKIFNRINGYRVHYDESTNGPADQPIQKLHTLMVLSVLGVSLVIYKFNDSTIMFIDYFCPYNGLSLLWLR